MKLNFLVVHFSGTHRKLWPVYGEYVYVPPQRWIHSLEHGAIVLLYHPCANLNQVNSQRPPSYFSQNSETNQILLSAGRR